MGHRTSSEVLPGLPRIDVPCCVCLGSEGQAIWPIEQVPRGSEGLPCLPCYAFYGPSVSLADWRPIGRLGCYCIYFFRPSKTNAQKMKVIHFYKKITCYFMVKSKKCLFSQLAAAVTAQTANRPPIGRNGIF